MKTARKTLQARVYALDCPHCSHELETPREGSLNWYSNEEYPETTKCAGCGADVRLPKLS